MRLTRLVLIGLCLSGCAQRDPECTGFDPIARAELDVAAQAAEPKALFERCGLDEAAQSAYRDARERAIARTCAPARGFERARKGESAASPCDARGYTEAFQLGALLRGHEQALDTLRSEIAGLPDNDEGKAKRGQLQRRARAREVEVENLRGVAAVRGWL